MSEPTLVLYWDASAVLSLLFTDSHSAAAMDWWGRPGGVHLLSTLTYTEVCAVIARMEREQILTGALAMVAHASFSSLAWRRTTAQPAWEIVPPIAHKWPLRGADLWHLACAKTLQRQFPEFHLLTFDNRLQEAAGGEGLLLAPDQGI